MSSHILPKIELKSSTENEAGLFLKFLHHDFHKQQKNMIFNSFPDLKKELENNELAEEKDIIDRFVSNFYNKNSEKIISIINNDKELLSQKGEEIIHALNELMDADWPDRPVIYAIPTILPFSLFQGNNFYYSILARIRRVKVDFRTVLYVAAHEISHFVFYDTLKEIKPYLFLSKAGEHYLKEALAPAVLNEEPLKNILKLENYSGNPELQNLNLSIDGEIIGFTKFISNYYHKHKIVNKEKFEDILLGLINILSPADHNLISKKDIWNRYGIKINEDIHAMKIYSDPISINKKNVI